MNGIFPFSRKFEFGKNIKITNETQMKNVNGMRETELINISREYEAPAFFDVIFPECIV